MYPIAFRDHLQVVREYMALIPGTRACRKAFAALCKALPDPEDFDPQVKKWDRAVCICIIPMLLGFFLLLALCLHTTLQSRELFTPAEKRLCLVFSVLFLLPAIPMLYADARKKHLAESRMDAEIRNFGESLLLLSDEQFARVQALLNSDPEYVYGNEPPAPGDACGCCKCRYTFPADSPDLNRETDFLVCPRCASVHLVYGTAEVPVDEETMQLIHNLFFEEK